MALTNKNTSNAGGKTNKKVNNNILLILVIQRSPHNVSQFYLATGLHLNTKIRHLFFPYIRLLERISEIEIIIVAPEVEQHDVTGSSLIDNR